MSPRRVNFTALSPADGLAARRGGGTSGGGIPEAPADGQLYGRRDKAWAPVPDPSGDIQALQGRMDTAEGEIDALQTSDTAQGERIDALETSDTAQDGKIAALETADTALGERLTAAEGDIDAAEDEIDDLTGRVEALEQGGGSESGPLMLDMNFVHDVFLIPSSPTSFEQYGQLLAGGLYDQLLAAAESGRPVISGGATDETAAYPVVYGTSLSDSGLVQLRGIDTGGDSGRQDIVNVTLSRSGTAPDYMYDGLHSVRPGYYSAMTSQPVALSTSAYALNQMDAAGLASMMGGGLFDLLFEAAGEGRFVLMGGASASTEKRPVLYRMQRIGSGTSRSLQLDATDTEGYPTVYAVTLFVNNENGTFSTDGTNIREL